MLQPKIKELLPLIHDAVHTLGVVVGKIIDLGDRCGEMSGLKPRMMFREFMGSTGPIWAPVSPRTCEGLLAVPDGHHCLTLDQAAKASGRSRRSLGLTWYSVWRDKIREDDFNQVLQHDFPEFWKELQLTRRRRQRQRQRQRRA
jgi:hypothetical protein